MLTIIDLNDELHSTLINADLIARGIEIKGGAAQTDRAAKIAKGMAELDEKYHPVLRSSDSPTGRKT
jgi:aspartyl/asparaginyl-tRNA synthetase